MNDRNIKVEDLFVCFFKVCKNYTYKHVISSFVSGRITVKVFCKAWFYMCAFILGGEKKGKKHYYYSYVKEVNNYKRIV